MTYSCFRIIGWKVHFTVEDHWNVKVVDCFKLWSWRKLKNSWWFTTHFAVFIFFRHIATGGYSTTKMTATMCNQLVMKLGHLQTERAGCLTLEQSAGFTTTCNWPQTAKQFNAIRCRSLVFFVVSQMLPTYFSSSVTGPLKTPGKSWQILHSLHYGMQRGKMFRYMPLKADQNQHLLITHGAVLFALVLYAHSIMIVLYNVCIAFIVCLHCLHVVCVIWVTVNQK